MKPLTLQQAGRHALDVIVEHGGFAAPTWDNLPQKLVLTYTEVTEAEQGVLTATGDPLEEELADIAIRVTGMLWGIWGDEWDARNGPLISLNRFAAIEVLLRPIRDYLTRAVEAWRKDRRVDVRIALELALRETEKVARALGVDLVTEMEKKTAKNAARPRLHGNARSDG